MHIPLLGSRALLSIGFTCHNRVHTLLPSGSIIQDANRVRANSVARMDSFLLSFAHIVFVFIMIPVFFYQLYVILSLVGFCRDRDKLIVKKEDLMLKAVEVPKTQRKKSKAAVNDVNPSIEEASTLEEHL